MGRASIEKFYVHNGGGFYDISCTRFFVELSLWEAGFHWSPILFAFAVDASLSDRICYGLTDWLV